MRVPAGVKQATIEAVVIRADGTRENLGVVSCYHKRWRDRIKCRFGRYEH